MSLIARLAVALQLETAAFERGSKRAAAEVNALGGKMEKGALAVGKLGKAVVAAGAVLAASSIAMHLKEMVKQGLDYASALGEQAAAAGVSTRALQEYRYIATQVNLSQEEMDASLARLTRTMGEAAGGAKRPADAFARLGIDIKAFVASGGDAGDLMPLIAEGLKGLGSESERAAVLVDLFGRSGQKLGAMMAEGAKGVNAMRDRARELGIVMSDDLIAKADVAADKVATLQKVLDMKIAITVAENADAISDLASALLKLVGAAGQAVRAWREFKMAQGIAQEEARLRSPWTSGADKIDALGKIVRYNRARSRLNAAPDTQGAFRDYTAAPLGIGGGLAGKAAIASLIPLPTRVSAALGGQRAAGMSGPPKTELDHEIALQVYEFGRRMEDFWSEEDRRMIESINRRRDLEIEARKELQDTLRRREEAQIGALAGLYTRAFQGGTKAIWRDFRSIGLNVIAEVLARFTISRLSGGSGFNFGSALGSALTGILGFADGGRPPVGRVSMVGERGPELFVPDRPGTILPNHALGGGPTFVINAPGATAETVAMIRREMASAFPAMVEAATANTTRQLSRRRL